MINEFVRVFRKEASEFEKNNDREVIEILFQILKNQELFNQALNEIKEDEKNENGGTIFLNLLSCMPFSMRLVESFLENNFLDDNDAYNKIKILFSTNSKIIDILQKYKMNLRNSNNIKSSALDGKLDEITKELKKREKDIAKIKELEAKRAKLSKTKKVNIKDLEDEVLKLEKIKSELNSLEKEINKKKNIFKNLPKDCS